MAKHDYDAESMTSSQIMSSVRVYREGVTVGFISSFGCEDYEVPARPTGAHRHDECDIPTAVWVFPPHYIECPRPNGCYEYIFTPRV